MGFCACQPFNLGSTLAIQRKQELCPPSSEPAAGSDQASVQLMWMMELIFQKKRSFLGCGSTGWGSDVTELRDHSVWGREEQDVK